MLKGVCVCCVSVCLYVHVLCVRMHVSCLGSGIQVTRPSEELYKRQPMAVFRSATQRMAASLLAKVSRHYVRILSASPLLHHS